jgi:hypothetical protein
MLMAMKIKLILASLLLSFTTFAASPTITFSVDTEAPRVFQVQTYAGNTPTITVNIQSGGSNFLNMGAGWTAEFNYAKSDASSYIKTITGTVDAATGVATFNCVTNSFPASGDYFGEVFLENGSTKITSGQGLVRVLRSPSSGSTGSLNLQNVINWDIVSSIGTLPWSDFDTNYLSGLISANLASANATSAVFQALFNAQGNTNSGFQALHNAQANTNSGFQALHTAQAATNALKVDTVTFNATNALKVDVSTFNASGAVWQAQTTANLTNQTATNSLFQTLFNNLASTNSLFQGLFTAQASTNSLFQGLFNALASTNSLFQGLFNAQANTNTSLQNQITANYTNQNVTNVAVQVQIAGLSSAGLYRYDAYPAVANTIWVLATATNVTASRSGATFTFTIPASTRVLEKKIRIDAANTDSGNIYIVLGTNDVNQAALATYWNSVVSAFREDTLANVPVTCTPYSGDNSQQKISGLGTVAGIWYHVELR